MSLFRGKLTLPLEQKSSFVFVWNCFLSQQFNLDCLSVHYPRNEKERMLTCSFVFLFALILFLHLLCPLQLLVTTPIVNFQVFSLLPSSVPLAKCQVLRKMMACRDTTQNGCSLVLLYTVFFYFVSVVHNLP